LLRGFAVLPWNGRLGRADLSTEEVSVAQPLLIRTPR